MFAIVAVSISMHQSVFLSRLALLPESSAILLSVLCYQTPQKTFRPRQAQVFIWVLAVGLLEFSIHFWMGGFLVFLWAITKMGRSGQDDGDIVVSSLHAQGYSTTDESGNTGVFTLLDCFSDIPWSVSCKHMSIVVACLENANSPQDMRALI
jgi:hypothetical protein